MKEKQRFLCKACRRTSRKGDDREKINVTKIPANQKEIQILGVDELFTFYKENPKNPISGLLWTESGMKLLTSKSVRADLQSCAGGWRRNSSQ